MSKKFRKGERHDSLRDLLPELVRRAVRRRSADALERDEFWALRNVSFEVQAGEALGIIGANGAGKSTALKVLCRILKPTSGRRAVRGRVGSLIEVASGFHPDLTGRENVFLQGAIMGMTRIEIGREFDSIVEFAEVGEFIDTPVKRYSSGMNARLGFSIAAHLQPDVLIIDEVLSVGDMRFQQKCIARMEEFLRRGVAVVFVSHNLAAVRQLCTRALMLSHGTVSAFGPSEDVIAEYGRSQTQRTALASAAVDIHFAFSDAQTGARIVKSGERVSFHLDLKVHTRFRGLIGIAVWDVVRALYVYGATSDSAGVPVLNLEAGEAASFAFSLAANLPRGTYTVEVFMHDSSWQRRVAVLSAAGTFTVVEQATYNSVANLFLAGQRIDHRSEPGRTHVTSGDVVSTAKESIS